MGIFKTMPTVCFFSHDQLRATTATSAADGIIVGHGGLKDPADHLTGDDADPGSGRGSRYRG